MLKSARKTISVRVDPENHSFLQNQSSISDCVNTLITRERLKFSNSNEEEIHFKQKLEELNLESKRQEEIVQIESRKLRRPG